MRVVFVIAIITACFACKAAPAGAPRADNGLRTDTNFDGLDVKDTVEDPGYISAGEALAAETASIVVGQPAPLAVMTTIDGETINLANIYGKTPVYIKFWATWCVPCRQQMPGFQKTFERFGDKIQFIALNIGLSDDESSVRTMQQKYGLKMPIIMDDGRLAALFHLVVTPQHVLIGTDVRFAHVGHAEDNRLRKAIESVVANAGPLKPVQAITETKTTPLRVGDRVPATTVTTMSGATVQLGGARSGKLQVVQFLSSWCEWYLEKTRPGTSKACASRRQEIEQIAKQDPNVEWLGVAGGPWATAQDLADYQKNNGVTIPLALDQQGALFRTFGIRNIPTIVLIDASGIIVNIIADNKVDVASAIRGAQAKR